MNTKTLFFVLTLVAVAVAAYWFGNRQAGTAIAPDDGNVTINRAQEQTTASPTKVQKKESRRTVVAPRDTKPRQTNITTTTPPNTVASDAPFIERFDDLKERAEAGDSMATCEIVKTLQTCQGLKRTRLQMANMVRRQKKPDTTNDPEQTKRFNDRLDKLQTRLDLMEQTCTGLSQEDHQQAFYFQQLGAMQGAPQLQRMFLQNPAIEGMSFDQVLDSLRIYQQVAPELGLEMLERGDASAVQHLASINMQGGGFMDGSDPMQGAIYSWLSYQMSNTLGTPEDESEAESMRDRMRIMHDLTDAQIDEAKAQAAAMRDRYFPDWDNLSEEERGKRMHPHWAAIEKRSENQLDLTCTDEP